MTKLEIIILGKKYSLHPPPIILPQFGLPQICLKIILSIILPTMLRQLGVPKIYHKIILYENSQNSTKKYILGKFEIKTATSSLPKLYLPPSIFPYFH